MKPIVLIVDDNEANRDTLFDLLPQNDYKLVEAEDGQSALSLAKEAPPDLVLLDVMMPGIDGLEVCRRLRADERLAEVPVIMLTSLDDQDSRLTAIEAGADDFVSKPFDRAELRARVRTITRLNRYRRLTEIQDKLHQSELRFQKLAEHSAEVFWFVSLDPEKTIYIGPAMEALTELPVSQFYEDPDLRMKIIHPEDQPRVKQAYDEVIAKKANRFEEEYRITRPNGDIRWVLDSGTPISEEGDGIKLGGVIRDITERKDSENRMLRAQRLENIGMLSAGVAHDFNNALAPILMAEEIMRQSITDENVIRLLDTVEQSANRGANLVKQLLSFARGASDARQILQARHMLNELTEMIEMTFPKSITLRAELPGDLWTVHANPTEIHQLFLNLCVNARDAMPEGGDLIISATNRILDSDTAGEIPNAKAGNFLAVEVRDTGSGMPPEVLKKLWDPFYTTKAEGSGTGLGLSTVRGIVQNHEGFIALESKVNRGTSFTVFLPASESPSTADSETKKGPPARGNGELILVVDDEEAVRETVAEILNSHGYETLLACDGAEAIAVFTSRAKDVKLLLTDIQMPLLDGSVLSTALHRMNPDLPVIAMSGVGSHASAGHKEFAAAFLAKPFQGNTLLSTVHETLSEKATANQSTPPFPNGKEEI